MLSESLQINARQAAYDAVRKVLGEFRYADEWANEAADKMLELERDGKGPGRLGQAREHYQERLDWYATHPRDIGSEYHIKVIAFLAAADAYIAYAVENIATKMESNGEVIVNDDGTVQLNAK